MDDAGDIGVMTFPLSSFVPEAWPLSFIKIDAEGCDEIIIKSSLNTIGFFRPVIMAEISRETGERLANNLGEYKVIVLSGSHNAFMVPSEKLVLFNV